MKGYTAVSISHRRGSWIKRSVWRNFYRVLNEVLESDNQTLAPMIGLNLEDLTADDWQVKPRTVTTIDAQIAKLQARRESLMKGAK